MINYSLLFVFYNLIVNPVIRLTQERQALRTELSPGARELPLDKGLLVVGRAVRIHNLQNLLLILQRRSRNILPEIFPVLGHKLHLEQVFRDTVSIDHIVLEGLGTMKGQIVIPAKARKLFDISPGDQLVVLGDEGQGIAIVKAESFLSLAGMIAKLKG